VSFYGGEPLLELDLIKAVVAEARSHPDWPPFRFIIDTNGTLLNDEAVAFITQEGVHLQISLDGPRHLHDLHRVTQDGRGSHAVILAGLQRLLQRRPDMARRISFIVTLAPPYDLLAVAEFFQDFPLWRQLGLDAPVQVRVNFADLEGIPPSAVACTDRAYGEPQRNLDQARSLYIAAATEGHRDRLSPVLTAFFDQGLIGFYHRQRGPLQTPVTLQGCCLPGQRRLHVRTDGALQTCERVGESLVIGDVQSGIDLAVVDRLFEGMQAALGKRCLDCWAVRLCDLCFTALAPTWREKGSERISIPEQICAQIRSSKEEAMRLYLSLLQRGPQSLDFLLSTSVS
jgi:uncharacterized protein